MNHDREPPMSEKGREFQHKFVTGSCIFMVLAGLAKFLYENLAPHGDQAWGKEAVGLGVLLAVGWYTVGHFWIESDYRDSHLGDQ